MSLGRWIFCGWRELLPTGQISDWTWTAVEASATPNAEQLAVIARCDNPRGAAVFRFEQRLDPDISWAWVEDWYATGLGAQTIAELDLPAQQQAVVDVWRHLSNVLRAANVAPYALPVYRDAWERRVGRPTPTHPYGESAPWRSEVERLAGVVDGLTLPWNGNALGCTVFRPLSERGPHDGGDCGRDEHRLWLTAEGVLDSSRIRPAEGALQGYPGTNCEQRLGGWDCAEWAWSPYCAGGCLVGQSPNTEDLYALAPLRWYWDLAREVLDWIRGAGPLGAVWAARLGAVEANRATLKALGRPVGGDPAWLAGGRDALRDLARERMMEEINTALGIAGLAGAATGVTGAAVLGSYIAVARAVTELALALGGIAYARFEDVFNRPFPVLESAEIRTDAEDVAAILPGPPGFLGIGLGTGTVPVRECGTPGARPPPDCYMTTHVPGEDKPKGGGALLALGVLGALGVGGALWLTRHNR